MITPSIWIDGNSIAAKSYKTWSDLPAFVLEDFAQIEQAFERTASDTQSIIILQGGDGFVSKIMTHYHQQGWSARNCAFQFLPLNVSGTCQVLGQTLGIPDDAKKAAKQCMRALRRKSFRHVFCPTLRIASTLHPTTLAFHVGLGDVVRLVEASQSKPSMGLLTLVRAMASDVGTTPISQPIKMIVNHQPLEMPGYILFGALSKTLFDVALDEQNPSYTIGSSLLTLAQTIARSQVPFSLGKSNAMTTPLELACWDSKAPCIIDGEVLTSPQEVVYQLGAGPHVPLLALN